MYTVYPIRLLLEPCTSPIYVLRYTTDLGCFCLVSSSSTVSYIHTCFQSGGGGGGLHAIYELVSFPDPSEKWDGLGTRLAMNNVVLTKLRIELIINI